MAIILDTLNDSLRTFSPCSVGRGTRLAGGVSTFGSNEVAQLVEVDSSGVATVGVAVGPGDLERGTWRAAAPNPFRDRVTFRYSTAGAVQGSITIHDIPGRRIRALPMNALAAGSHAIVWDGRDERGASVRPGVYLADLVIAGQRHRQMVVRLK